MVWYLSITTHNMVVTEYEYADLVQSLDKCSHNFIFYMLKHYNYPVNLLCAMAAQGMKTVYADPWNMNKQYNSILIIY
jgi:hypothetical protein